MRPLTSPLSLCPGSAIFSLWIFEQISLSRTQFLICEMGEPQVVVMEIKWIHRCTVLVSVAGRSCQYVYPYRHCEWWQELLCGFPGPQGFTVALAALVKSSLFTLFCFRCQSCHANFSLWFLWLETGCPSSRWWWVNIWEFSSCDCVFSWLKLKPHQRNMRCTYVEFVYIYMVHL